jgi:hypothetical protein
MPHGTCNSVSSHKRLISLAVASMSVMSWSIPRRNSTDARVYQYKATTLFLRHFRGTEYSPRSATGQLLCTHSSPALRPTQGQTPSRLNHAVDVVAPLISKKLVTGDLANHCQSLLENRASLRLPLQGLLSTPPFLDTPPDQIVPIHTIGTSFRPHCDRQWT